MKRPRLSPAAIFLLLAIAFAMWLATVARGQTFTAVMQDDAVANVAVTYTVLASPTNDATSLYWIAWSGTNAVPFTESQISAADTNQPYNSPMMLTLTVNIGGGKYAPMKKVLFDPLKSGSTVIFTPSNNVPLSGVLPITNTPAVTVVGTNSFHVWIKTAYGLTSPFVDLTNFEIGCAFAAKFNRASGQQFFMCGVSSGTNTAPATWITNQ